MRRVVVSLSLAGLLMAVLAGGGSAAPQDSAAGPGELPDDAIPDQWIVNVADDADPRGVAAEHRAEQGAEIRHVYETVLGGYAAVMPSHVAERVAADPRVASVEPDREVTIAHHQCGHGGPGHPDDACDDGTVSGTVTDAASNQGVEGATVSIDDDEDWTAVTDADGTYEIPEEEGKVDGASERDIAVSHKDYEDAEDTITVDGDTTWDAELEPANGEDPQTGDLEGTVSDDDGDVLEGATVTLEETGQSATTDDGDYLIEDVEEGKYTATAEAEGYESASEDVEIEADETTEQDFQLEAEEEEDEDADGAEETPWGVERTGADDVHDEFTGDGVSVYIIDSGIDSTHVDLEPNLGDGFAAVSCRGGGCDEDWDDDHGHGTHVAGTAGATDAEQVVGVAPEATLHAVKVLSNQGRGNRSDVIAGIDHVAGEAEEEDDAVVANMSLGGDGEKSGTCTDDDFDGDDSYHEAICDATREGVVFAVAAGNSDADAAATVPAAYHDTVLTVSATDEDDTFAEFSNWGDDSFDWTEDEDEQPNPQSAPVALAAPGVDVLSTWPDGDELHEGSGTSMAAPHVAGGAALHIQAEQLSGDEGRAAFLDVRAALMGEAEDASGFDDDSSFEGTREEGFLDLRYLANDTD